MDLERDRVVVFEDPERIEKPSLRSDFWSKKGEEGDGIIRCSRHSFPPSTTLMLAGVLECSL